MNSKIVKFRIDKELETLLKEYQSEDGNDNLSKLFRQGLKIALKNRKASK